MSQACHGLEGAASADAPAAAASVVAAAVVWARCFVVAVLALATCFSVPARVNFDGRKQWPSLVRLYLTTEETELFVFLTSCLRLAVRS